MFGKRFNILTISGFKIGIDISWFIIALLLTWTLAAGYFPTAYPGLGSHVYWYMGIAGMLGLFICVILHELGHAVVARHYNIPVNQITLFIFGGIAELKEEPKSPKVEFLMAIAGPIVSFALAFILYFLTSVATKHNWPVALKAVTGYLAVINFLLALFNMIPAFPLDGGRVLRALLWGWKKNLAWATKVSARIGSVFGFALIFLGIFYMLQGKLLSGFWFIIIGWFLYKAASSVQTQFYVGKELEGEKVSKFMKTDVITVPPHISLKECVEQYFYTSHHQIYPVTDQGNLFGYISLHEIKALPHAEWERTSVQSLMVPLSKIKTVTPETNALEAVQLFQESGMSMLFIAEKERFLGILTSQDLFKLISLKLELEENK